MTNQTNKNPPKKHQTVRDRLDDIHSRSRENKTASPETTSSPTDDAVVLKPGEDLSIARHVQGSMDYPDFNLLLGGRSEDDKRGPPGKVEPLEDPPELAECPELPGIPGLLNFDVLKKSRQTGPRPTVSRGKVLAAKRLVFIHDRYNTEMHGPQGEKKTQDIELWSQPLPLEQIVADTDFKNIRLDPEKDEIERLSQSMTSQGIKIPITVVEGGDGNYHLRAGFRRVKAARHLGWTFLPSIVMPLNTPEVSEYWANIIENTARKPLHTYELAAMAAKMRDEFQVDSKEFAKITCHDPKYIADLLRAFDRLPQEILEQWKKRARIPVTDYIAWSAMTEMEALKAYYLSRGIRHRKKIEQLERQKLLGQQGLPPGMSSPPPRPSGPIPERTATNRGLKRMERLKVALASSTLLSDKARKLCLQIVCFCEGTRDTIPGIYDDKARRRSIKGRKVKEEAETPAKEDTTLEDYLSACPEEYDDDDPVDSDVLQIPNIPPKP